MSEPRILEVIYIRTTRAELWDALTNPDVTARYWFDTRIESDWTVGAPVRYVRNGELTDEHVLLEVDHPRRLRQTFHPVFGEFAAEAPSRLTFSLEENGGVVRLTVLHDSFPEGSKVLPACRQGWPMILASLKTLLETGTPLPPFSFPPTDGDGVS